MNLDKVAKLWNVLSRPNPSRPIHITGTNGKGSVSAYISHILVESGLKVGSFNSPFLIEPNDAIRINLIPIPAERYAEMMDDTALVAKDHGIDVSMFEKTCLVAYTYFVMEKVDVSVIEVGLGGLLDATNIICNPIACVFTCITLDHVAILGNSVLEIATQKAGIIKCGARVIAGIQKYIDATAVIADRARLLECLFVKVEQRATLINNDLKKMASVMYNGSELAFPMNLAGAFQLENVATAIKTIECILDLLPVTISPSMISSALAKVVWRGRVETVQLPGWGPILVDGAHNPDAAIELAKVVDAMRITEQIVASGVRNVHWVIAATQGKDIATILAELVQPNDTVFVVGFGEVREMPWVKCLSVLELASYCTAAKRVIQGECIDSGLEFIEKNLPRGSLVVVCGSLYLIGDLLRNTRFLH